MDGSDHRALLTRLCESLRPIAAAHMRRQQPGHTLQTTAVLHEVFLKLDPADLSCANGESHLYRIGARAVRQVFLDHWRAVHRQKRVPADGVLQRAGIDLVAVSDPRLRSDVLDVHEQLVRLAEIDDDLATVAEMKLAGYTNEEIARAAACDARTVNRRWRKARTWLHRALRD